MDIYGIIGWPVEHSLSPAMHNAAFKKLGIDAEYRKFEVRPEGLEDFLINRKDVKGFNVTVPHKVKAKEILEKRFPCDPKDPYDLDVVLSGAVNTVKRVGDKIEYFNTDVSGFSASLEMDLGFKTSEHKRSNIFILGCGGAARAVIASFLQEPPGGNIYVYDINEKAMDSAKKHFSSNRIKKFISERELSFISKREIEEKINDSELLVNASPVGMNEGDPSPVDKRLLRKDLYVYDVVYNRETQLVKDARSEKAEAITGEGMLAWQGALAFSCWIDGCKAVDVIDLMKKELKSYLEKKNK